MSLLSDELLNKYLDNELDQASRVKVANQLEFSDEDRKRFIALQAVHNGLKKVKPLEVSSEFTSLLMVKLMKKNKAVKEQKIFIFSMGSFFMVASLLIIGIALSLALKSGAEESPVLTNFVTFTGYLADIMKKSFSGNNLSIIGSVISFGIIISAYFFFDTQKQTKNRLSKFN